MVCEDDEWYGVASTDHSWAKCRINDLNNGHTLLPVSTKMVKWMLLSKVRTLSNAKH